MGTFIDSHSTANPPLASSSDDIRPRIATYPDGFADLIAETLRLRAMCVTISQTIIVTRDLVQEMRRNYSSLLKLSRARRPLVNPAAPRGEGSSVVRGGTAAPWVRARPGPERETRRR